MVTKPQPRFSYPDLESFPEDNLRREIIDGELIVSAAPALRHQRVVRRLIVRFGIYCEEQGGEVLPAPYDVYFTESNVVEPDVLFVRKENVGSLEERYLRSRPPDIVIEVSSPSTRRLEIVRKRELYERFGVPEYWYVDLDAERVEVFRLKEGKYGLPQMLVAGDELSSDQAPGLSIPVAYVLGSNTAP